MDTLRLAATGKYPDWLRNGIFDAVHASYFAKGVIVTQGTTFQPQEGVNQNGPIFILQPCTISMAPQEINITFFSAPNMLEATLQVIATVKSIDDGFCSTGVAQGSALVGAVAGALGAWGAGIGAIFGTIFYYL